jgi:hypothetical protein
LRKSERHSDSEIRAGGAINEKRVVEVDWAGERFPEESTLVRFDVAAQTAAGRLT